MGCWEFYGEVVATEGLELWMIRFSVEGFRSGMADAGLQVRHLGRGLGLTVQR